MEFEPRPHGRLAHWGKKYCVRWDTDKKLLYSHRARRHSGFACKIANLPSNGIKVMFGLGAQSNQNNLG
jgi:hypothetical protein